MENVFRLLAAILIFVVVLFLTAFVTKMLANSGWASPSTKNMKVMETIKIAQNKFIQIVMIGSNYYAIGISKDEMTFISQIPAEELDFSATPNSNDRKFGGILGGSNNASFSDVWEKVKIASLKKKGNDKK